MFIYVQEVCGAAAGRGNDSHPHCSKRSFSCVFLNIHINMNMSVMTLKVTKFNCFVCLALYFLFLLLSAAAPSDHHFIICGGTNHAAFKTAMQNLVS